MELLLLQWVLGLGVFWVIMYITYQSSWSLKWVNEIMHLEFIWTVLPGLILVWLGLPSLKLLYQHEALAEGVDQYVLSVKVVGHQWYWSYDFRQFNLEFDSFINKSDDVSYYGGQVDNLLVLPFSVRVLALITREDVLHAYALPPLYIKVDATPARLNRAFLMSGVPSEMFGTCSELCGIEHSNIPIVVQFVSLYSFLRWIKSMRV